MNTITNIYPMKTSVMFRARAIPKPLSMPIANNRPAFIGLEPHSLSCFVDRLSSYIKIYKPKITQEQLTQCENKLKDNYGLLSEAERNNILSKIRYNKQAECLNKILDLRYTDDSPLFDKEVLILISNYIGSDNDNPVGSYIYSITNGLSEKIKKCDNYGKLAINTYCKTIFEFITDMSSESFVYELLRRDTSLFSIDNFLDTLNEVGDKRYAVNEASYIVTNTPDEFWKEIYYHLDSKDKIELCKKMSQQNKIAERENRANLYNRYSMDSILSDLDTLQYKYKDNRQSVYNLLSKAIDNKATRNLIDLLANEVKNFDALEPLIDLGILKDSKNTVKFSSWAVDAIAKACGGYDKVTPRDIQQIKNLVENAPDITTKQVIDRIKSGTLSDIPKSPEYKILDGIGEYKDYYERIINSNAFNELYPEAKIELRGYLRKLLNHDENRFINLVESGYFELRSKKDSPISVGDLFDNTNSDSFFSKNYLKDVKKLYSGEPLVKEFPAGTNLSEIADTVDKGEAASVGGKLYVNDDGKMTELKMSKETFEKLFPLVKRFNTGQGSLGDCWLVSAFENLMDLPSGRVKIYQLFEQNGDSITVTVPHYKYEQKRQGECEWYMMPMEIEPYKLSCNLDKLIDYSHCNHLEGCLGLQLLENLYTIAKDGGDKKELSHNDVLDLLHYPQKMDVLKGGFSYMPINNIIGCTEQIPDKYYADYKKFQNNKLTYVDKIEDVMDFLTFAANDDKILCYFSSDSTFDKLKRATRINPKYNLSLNHAYSIKGYDKDKGIVYYTNPNKGNSINEMDVYNWICYVDEIRYTKLGKENT